jgi:hypothetical protein
MQITSYGASRAHFVISLSGDTFYTSDMWVTVLRICSRKKRSSRLAFEMKKLVVSSIHFCCKFIIRFIIFCLPVRIAVSTRDLYQLCMYYMRVTCLRCLTIAII